MRDKQDSAHTGELPKAVIYLRVSTPSQVKKDYDREGLSLPAQREACKAKAAELGAVVTEEFVEPGVSARSVRKRRAFQAMLQAIAERGDIDYVIIWSVSRWARNQEDYWMARGLIRRAGARLKSVKENIGGEGSSDVIVEGVMAAVAEGRSIDTAEDVRRGITRKAEVGGTPYRAPIGYVNVRTIIDGHEVRDVVPDPERADLIREVFELYASETYTLEELAALMEARGLRSRASASQPAVPLTANRLSDLLRNEYYLGTVTVRGKPYRGRHEALVTPATFERVQEILEARRQNGARAWKHHHYLAGTLFCGSCGSRLLYSRNRGKLGKEYEYYLCVGKQQRRGCRQSYHRLEDIEAAVEAFYARVSLSEAEREALKAELLRRLDRLAGSSAADAAEADRSLTRLAAQEKKLLQAFYEDSVSPDLFHAEQQRIRRERIAAEGIKERLATDLSEVQNNVALALELMTNPSRAYCRGDARLRGLMNRGFFQALYVDNGDVTDGELQPVLDQLLEVWIDVAPKYQPRHAASRPRPARRPGAGQRPRTQRNPHAKGVEGSKVQTMVEAGGIEPPTPPCKGGVFPLAPRPRAVRV